MNNTILGAPLISEPLWHTAGALATEIAGFLIYTFLILLGCVVICGRDIDGFNKYHYLQKMGCVVNYGRDIVLSLLLSTFGCCFKQQTKRVIEWQEAKKQDQTHSSNLIVKLLSHYEVTSISIFFVYFVLFALYRAMVCALFIVSLSLRLYTQEAPWTYILFVIATGFNYGGFVVFLVFICLYVIILAHVGGVWFSFLQNGAKKKKIYLILVYILVALSFLVGGIVATITLEACLFLLVTNRQRFSIVVAIWGSIYGSAQSVLSTVTFGIIIFILVMIRKYGKNAADQEKTTLLKVYSVTLVSAILIFKGIGLLRITGVVLIGLASVGVPTFFSSICSRILPDLLDLVTCAVIYWPPMLACVPKGPLRNLLLPINFRELYECVNSLEKTNSFEMNIAMPMEEVKSESSIEAVEES